MSSTRWQIEPPPLAPGAGAQWLIAALVALGPFSLTMYQPALPAIARSLNISTAQVQLTLTVYLASFAIGQLIYGPYRRSDSSRLFVVSDSGPIHHRGRAWGASK